MPALLASSPVPLRGVVSSGDTIRVPAVLLRESVAVKGWQFSRSALEASAPQWIGRPVWVGTHQDKREVGHVTASGVFGGDLTVELELSASRLQDSGHRIQELREVSLEGWVQASRDERGGVTDASLTAAHGVVLLTEERGACSVEHGCGLKLSADRNCNCQEEGNMAPEQKTPNVVEQVRGMTWKSFIALAEAAGIEQPDADAPSADQVAAWKSDSEKYGALQEERKGEIVGKLIERGHYEESARADLLKLTVEELSERGRLVGLDKPEEPVEIAASRTPRIGSDRTIPQPAPTPTPSNTWDLIREANAKRFAS